MSWSAVAISRTRSVTSARACSCWPREERHQPRSGSTPSKWGFWRRTSSSRAWASSTMPWLKRATARKVLSRGCSGSAARPRSISADRLLEAALVGEDPRPVEGHDHHVLRVRARAGGRRSRGPSRRGRPGGRASRPRRGPTGRRAPPAAAPRSRRAGLVLVAVVQVHVDHLQPRVHDRRVGGEGVLERALGEHEVLGPAPALGVEDVAAAEGRVRAGRTRGRGRSPRASS